MEKEEMKLGSESMSLPDKPIGQIFSALPAGWC
jgi:hypothetical protein